MKSALYVPHERQFRFRLRTAGDAIAQAAGNSTARVLTVLSVLYAAVVYLLSSLKLLWLDELITLFVVKTGSFAAVWRALKLGADPNPPLSYFCVLLSTRLFGDGALALRLPAAIGYWIGLVSLYVYLRRRVPPVWALAGSLLSMAMAAFDYSFESRSYGLLYGLSTLSFLLWSLAVDTNTPAARRPFLVVCMTVVLLLSICTNYFAVLALIPIAGGELVRTVKPRYRASHRFVTTSVMVWMGLLATASTMLFFRPLMAKAVALYGPYAWNHVSLRRLTEGYTEMVESTLFPLLTLLLLPGLLLWLARLSKLDTLEGLTSLARAYAEREKVLPRHEMFAVFLFMAYPLLGYIAASLYGGMLSPRFVIPVCAGFSISGITALCRMFGGRQRSGAVMLCLFLAWFCAREVYLAYSYAQQNAGFALIEASINDALQHTHPGSSIAVPDPLFAVTLEHYARGSLRQRLAFPIDFSAVRRYRNDDSPEQNLWAGRTLLPVLRIVPLSEFESQTGTYLIVAAKSNWLLKELQQQKRQVTLLKAPVYADHLGGFTPLARGIPEIYLTHGDADDVVPDLAGNKLRVPFGNLDIPASSRGHTNADAKDLKESVVRKRRNGQPR